MYNYRLQLHYDGGRYDGWVRMGKDSNSNTIECKIKEIIQKMTGEDIDIYVGCRTEKGVHALNQTANFKLNDKYHAQLRGCCADAGGDLPGGHDHVVSH